MCIRDRLEDSVRKDKKQFIETKSEESVDSAVYSNVRYFPLLAIDASPKAWLHDYGVFGKQKYLDRVWESIEWKLVENRLPIFESKAFSS